ncbi:hypothetical protein D9757_004764 [Collybiopsis confluens]|uniref:Uncharacterized protein n=1 Tax=Collybiopsis confluens TaxID=2823264 RepID=A0A8H5MCB4_9AGAR|nr:hypothetical protein D9757_004764 [Collybiopsis confluens]
MSLQSRQRRNWTLEEDRQLLEAIKIEEPDSITKPSNWCAISKHVQNRTNKDCRKRWLSMHDGALIKTTKGSWSKEEDEQLRTAVESRGPRWCKVAEMVPGRNSDQCSKRWKDTLDPSIDRSKWSLEDDQQLLQAVDQLGRKWTRIVKQYFPGRTGLAAKNRYNCIAHRQPVPAVITKERSSSLSIRPLEWVTRRLSPASSSAISASASASHTSTSPISPSSSTSGLSSFSTSDPDSPISFYAPQILKFSRSQVRRVEAIGSDYGGQNLTPSPREIPDVDWPFSSPQCNPTPGALLDALHSVTGPLSVTPILKLFGSPRCCSTAKIALVLWEKQLAYQFYPLQAAEDDIQPYIVDSGLVQHGCQNACQYIATRYPHRGPRLILDLSDARGAAVFWQAMSVELRDFELHTRNVLCESMMRRQQGFLPNEISSGSAMRELSSILDRYEAILAHQKYLAGNEITLVDLYHLPYGEMLSTNGINVMFMKGPNLLRWWAEISSRPAWLAIKNGVPLKG